MSVNLFPVRFSHLWERPARKHRAPDEIDRLNHLLDGAKLLIKGLQGQLDDQEARHEATIARIDERHGETIRGLEQQITELQWRLNIACKAESAVAITQPIPVITRVMPLPEAASAGLLGPVTDPGHVQGVA